MCDEIAQLHCSVVGGANRAVLYDLYPYVWDLRNMALVAKAFIGWLGESPRGRRRWSPHQTSSSTYPSPSDGRVLSDSSTLGSWKTCFHCE